MEEEGGDGKGFGGRQSIRGIFRDDLREVGLCSWRLKVRYAGDWDGICRGGLDLVCIYILCGCVLLGGCSPRAKFKGRGGWKGV